MRAKDKMRSLLEECLLMLELYAKHNDPAWDGTATQISLIGKIRQALAAKQAPARFNGEQALAEWEAKHGGGK